MTFSFVRAHNGSGIHEAADEQRQRRMHNRLPERPVQRGERKRAQQWQRQWQRPQQRQRPRRLLQSTLPGTGRHSVQERELHSGLGLQQR